MSESLNDPMIDIGMLKSSHSFCVAYDRPIWGCSSDHCRGVSNQDEFFIENAEFLQQGGAPVHKLSRLVSKIPVYNCGL